VTLSTLSERPSTVSDTATTPSRKSGTIGTLASFLTVFPCHGAVLQFRDGVRHRHESVTSVRHASHGGGR